MAGKNEDRELLAPAISIEKYCKKCKQKVKSAYTKCVDCEVTYHNSCFEDLSQKVRAHIVLLGNNQIRCDSHPTSPIPEDFEFYQKTVMDLKKENRQLKNEIKKLMEENSRLNKLNRGSPSEEGDTVSVKTISDKIKEDVVDFLQRMETKINNNIHKQLEAFRESSKENRSKTNEEKQNISCSQMPKKNVICVKPKAEQSSSATWEMLQKKINPEEFNVGITEVKRLKSGSVIIGCQNAEDLNMI